MKVIDDEGNLFGYVNVVDALVVLLVIAVLIAGLALLGFFGDDDDPEFRYATVDLGSQPEYVAEQISAGDQMSLRDTDQNVTITDVHRSATEGGGPGSDTSVVVRARVLGRLVDTERRDEPEFQFDGERLGVGQELTIDTPEYTVGGSVTRMGDSRDTLPTSETDVLAETTMPVRQAAEVQVGDTYTIAGSDIATVESVRSYPIDGDNRRLHVGLTLSTLERSDRTTFGNRPLSLGTGIGFSTDAYDLSGSVIRRGSLEPPGTPGTTRATVEINNLRPRQADGISAGMTETERGETQVTVRSVDTQPADAVLESEDGNIYLREHPRNLDLEMTVDLATRSTENGLEFHGAPLREGNSVTFNFGTIVVSGTVAEINDT